MSHVNIIKFLNDDNRWGLFNEDVGSVIAIISDSNLKTLAEQIKKEGFS
jgi:hypothetical protein